MWANFIPDTEYTLTGGKFNFLTKDRDSYFGMRFYADGVNVDLKRNFVLSFWMKPMTDGIDAQFGIGNKAANNLTTVLKITNNVFVINGVTYNNVKLTKGEWALIEIACHYDAEKGGTYAYTVMLNGETIVTIDAPTVHEEIDWLRIFRYADGPFSVDNLIFATGTESLINTLSPAPTIDCSDHVYDNACDTECNKCGEGREVPDHTYDNACDADCNVCGATREVADHVYDNIFDADCNVCGEVRDLTPTEGSVSKSITWKFENGVLTITGKGKIKNFNAGTTPWNSFADLITEVVISEGITYVGSSAFYNCTNLAKVTLPETLTAIGNYAFYKCTALKSVKIPAAVTEIGIYAFRSTGITTAEFGITYGWTAGETAYTSNEVKTSAAALLKKAGKVVWSRDINAEEDVVDESFVDGGICKNGTTKWAITLLENGKYKLTISGNGKMPEFSTGEAPWYKTEYALQIVEIEIAEGVTNVGRCAFYGLKYVSKVTVSSTVTSIGDYGFYMCRMLKSIDLPAGITHIGTQAFEKTGLAEIPTV